MREPVSWMSGSFDLGGLSITWNRFWIVIFAIAVFFALLAVLNRTPLGLQMRAVTSEPPHGQRHGHPHAVRRCR